MCQLRSYFELVFELLTRIEEADPTRVSRYQQKLLLILSPCTLKLFYYKDLKNYNCAQAILMFRFNSLQEI